MLRRCGAVLACLALMGIAAGPGAGEPIGPQAGRIVANYDAGLAGISLGEFKVIATLDKDAYAVEANGDFSLLAGLLYKASGKTASNGKLTGTAPQPARYTLSFKDSKKQQKLRMNFARGAVTDVTIVPRKKPHPRDVPVTAEQLRGVLDPLTAAFLGVRSDAPAGDLAVCEQTIRIFDGRQRFDLSLTPKRSETLDRGAPKGLPGRAAVCRVKYKPVGGYRPDHPGIQYMTNNDKVEVWLVPVPGAGVYIPYRILIPTAWGTGSVELTGIKANLKAQRAGVP